MFAGVFRSTAAPRKKAGGSRAGPLHHEKGPAGAREPPAGRGFAAKGDAGPGKQKKQKKGKGDAEHRGAAAAAAGEAPVGEGLSKKARKRARQRHQQDDQEKTRTGKRARQDELAPSLLSAATGKSPVGRAAVRLQGSRFRWLNEKLYTTTGAEAKALYDEDPSLAHAYHEGFRAQAAKWPKNPLDDVVAWCKKEVPKTKVIGDFGCGEARLALELSGHKVHSLDLIAVNERVTPCNLADVPLDNDSLDVVVFCLALMGTDWPQFLAEAHRCLVPKGILHIMEVESRFADVQALIAQIEAIGFKKVHFKPGNFFVEFRFVKAGRGGNVGGGGKAKRKVAGGGKLLRECTYRRR